VFVCVCVCVCVYVLKFLPLSTRVDILISMNLKGTVRQKNSDICEIWCLHLRGKYGLQVSQRKFLNFYQAVRRHIPKGSSPHF